MPPTSQPKVKATGTSSPHIAVRRDLIGAAGSMRVRTVAIKERARRVPGSSCSCLLSACGRGRRGHEAQLLEHAHLVLHRPMLDDLAVLDPADMDGLPFRGLAARRHPGKFALHRA